MKQNKKSHTTSTKCQYQIEVSRPTCLSPLKLIKRIRQTLSNRHPRNTWNPWNPVNIKKPVPYAPSLIENLAEAYSLPCTNKNTTPSATVSANGNLLFRLILLVSSLVFPCKRPLCTHVTVTPDLSKMMVFNNGTPSPSITSIPFCGHSEPPSTTGTKAKVKNLQKKEAKNITSDVINKINANRAPLEKSLDMRPTRDSLPTETPHIEMMAIRKTNETKNPPHTPEVKPTNKQKTNKQTKNLSITG